LVVYHRPLHYANFARDGGWRPSGKWRIDVFEYEGKTLAAVPWLLPEATGLLESSKAQ